jgi:hypothetical protein
MGVAQQENRDSRDPNRVSMEEFDRTRFSLPPKSPLAKILQEDQSVVRELAERETA